MTSRTLPTTAADLHEHLQLLRLDRALDPADPDIVEEIDATITAYVGAAITEIASLRGDLGARLVG